MRNVFILGNFSSVCTRYYEGWVPATSESPFPLASQEAGLLKEEKTQQITSPYPKAHWFLTSCVSHLPRRTNDQGYGLGGVLYIILLPSTQTLRSKGNQLLPSYVWPEPTYTRTIDTITIWHRDDVKMSLHMIKLCHYPFHLKPPIPFSMSAVLNFSCKSPDSTCFRHCKLCMSSLLIHALHSPPDPFFLYLQPFFCL